ncbi:TPA: hypothetical protein ACH3X1_000984 [Trebouxia sp. C0004]
MPFPYNNTIDGPLFERLVAISIASKAHLFSAGITNAHKVGGSFDLTVDSETCLEALSSHLAWDDPIFLVFMDSVFGSPAPSGDLRFVVETLTGKRQVVVVQCKRVGAGTRAGRDRTASIQDVQHHLTQLRL